ncbi:unnamed protein product [Cyclocybe aegerita]|uniref:MYND-type domain-containing protein n=1 Tax=Cyclocybe aegerita TaxID=1973307 RepID=A0A8S0WHY2_CYCAE|nr:unnamed protein product [Cyclocybe aegerita]
MQSSLSQPLLPRHLVDEIQRTYGAAYLTMSDVSQEASHEYRLAMRNWNGPLPPDIHLCNELDPAFSQKAKRTYLHYMAATADILSACELLYCGASPDKASPDGYTPIFSALAELAVRRFRSFVTPLLPPSYLPSVVNCPPQYLPAYSHIAKILIEQHIDVNQTVHRVSILRLACLAKDWDIIGLLFEHGANDTISSSTSTFKATFPTASDRKRYTALVAAKRLPEGQQRPARMCPCWSGKRVSECHGKLGAKVPYPLDYVCVCGSEKTYRRCCSRKAKLSVIEEWKSDICRIMHRYDEKDDMAEINQKLQELMKKGQLMEDSLRRAIGLPEDPAKNHTMYTDPNEFGKRVTEQGLVDPAFGYAMCRYPDRVPLPVDRTVRSRQVMEGRHAIWNSLVDEYIALGTDSRSAFEIARAAKVGTWGGAYIRQCEGENCDKVEQKDVEKLQQCIKCQMAVYCGRECQKSAWPTHKKVCSTPAQRPQLLPSQMAVLKKVMPAIANGEVLLYLPS